MPILNRLNGPCFGLTWLRVSPGEDGCVNTVALLPGGGGTTFKSGVKNYIHVMRFVGAAGCELLSSIQTEELCECVSGGDCEGVTMICASFSSKCSLMELSVTADGKISSKTLADFASAELVEADMSMNASIFSKNRIVTGGENGVCYLWNIQRVKGSWNVSKVCELSGHQGPVKSLSVHPVEEWVVSGSDDGTCRVWDLERRCEIAVAVCSTDGTTQQATTKAKSPAKSQQVKCRGAVFSPDGESLYTLQSCGTGPAHIVTWRVEKDKTKDKLSVSVAPMKAIKASNVPGCRLVISDEAEKSILVLGDCEGCVAVFDLPTLTKVSMDRCHDFPVTGLGIAPRIVISETGDTKASNVSDIVVSCSADYKLATIMRKGSPGCLAYVIRFLLFLTLLFFLLVAMKKMNGDGTVIG